MRRRTVLRRGATAGARSQLYSVLRNFWSMTDDASDTRDGTTTYTTGNFVWFRPHANTTLTQTAGFRWAVPDTINPADVVSATVIATASNMGTWAGDIAFESDAAAFASSPSGSRPSQRYAAAASENGSVAWDQGATTTAGVDYNSPDVTTEVVSALNNSTPSDGYRYIAGLFQADNGVSPAGVQVASREHGSENGIILELVTNEPYENRYTVIEDIDYSGVSAVGAIAARVLDLYIPGDAASVPASGWPVIAFVHGGRFISGSLDIGPSENNLSQEFVNLMVDQGYAVASINYRLCQSTVNPGAIYTSFPMNVHDVYAALVWLEENAVTYSLNPAKVIPAGHSAGGTLAAWATVAACFDDSTTYDGTQSNATGGRPSGYGYTDDASPWQFDLDENGELALTNKPAGLLLWDSPIDLQNATTIADPAGTANTAAREALYGETLGGGVAGTADDADLNHYLLGDGDTIWTGAEKDDTLLPPICMVYSSTEDGIPNSSSVTSLYNTLNTMGYDVSTGVGTLNTLGGLTRYSVPRDHADVLRESVPFENEIAWLREVLA